MVRTKFRSLTALAIALLMAFPMMARPAAAADETENRTATNLVLSMLGLGDDGSFEQEYVTREGFALNLYQALGFDADAVGQQSIYFTDVPKKSHLAAVTDLLVGMNILSQSPEQKFNPNFPVKYEQGIKMLVAAAGYEFKAAALGGYPEGYLAVGGSLSLSKGVTAQIGDYLSGDQMAKLLFNFLTVPVAVPQSVGEGRTEYTIDEDATVLSEYWNMTKKRGKVTGNRFTRLEKPDALKKGLIEIDGQAYQSLDTFADEYLGYEVEYYLESDGVNEEIVHCVMPTKRNNVLTVSSKDIDKSKTTKTQFWYYEDETKDSQRAEVARSADFIYNKKVYHDYTDKDFVPENGSVTLIDNNGDEMYDVAVVTNAEIIVVDSVGAATSMVYNKYTFGELNSLELDEKASDYDFEILKNGKNIMLSSLAENDVLEVCRSKNDGDKFISVNVVNRSISGLLTGISNDGSNLALTVEGDEYDVSEFYMNALAANDPMCVELSAGLYAQFLLDSNRRIVGIMLDGESTRNYAWLIGVDEGISMKTAKLKLFLMSGETKIFQTADKVTVNGSSVRQNVVPGLVSSGQLIIFKLNIYDEIIAIETAQACALNEHQKGVFSMTHNTNGDAGGTSKFKNTNNGFNSSVFIQSSKVLTVPTDGSEEGLLWANYNTFNSNYSYNVDFYDVADYVPKVVVYHKSPSDQASEQYMNSFVIDKITLAEKDGDIVQKVTGAFNKKTDTYYTATDGVLDGYKSGDAIRISVNKDGRIDAVTEQTISIDKINLGNDENGCFQAGTFDTSNRIVIGRVAKIFAASKRIEIDTSYANGGGGGIVIADLSWTGATTGVYDRKSEKAYAGSFNDVTQDSVIYLRMTNERAYEVIIYR